MIRIRVRYLVSLITALAMIVQLGVVAHHHHDGVVPGLHASHVSADHTGVIAHAHDDHQHAHHEHDAHHGGHHDPADEDHHDCDLCLVKTTLSSAVIPHAVGGLDVQSAAAKLHFARWDVRLSDTITERFRARAPPIKRRLIS